jgi:hypothetical protein
MIIIETPKMTTKQAFDNGVLVAQNLQSIHTNPFRNHKDLNDQFIAWKDGWKSIKPQHS